MAATRFFSYQGQTLSINQICIASGITNFAFQRLTNGLVNEGDDLTDIVSIERWEALKHKPKEYRFKGQLNSAQEIADRLDVQLPTITGTLKRHNVPEGSEVDYLLSNIKPATTTKENTTVYFFLGGEYTLRELANTFSRNLNSVRYASYRLFENIDGNNIFDALAFESEAMPNRVQYCGWRTKESFVYFEGSLKTVTEMCKTLGQSRTQINRKFETLNFSH